MPLLTITVTIRTDETLDELTVLEHEVTEALRDLGDIQTVDIEEDETNWNDDLPK